MLQFTHMTTDLNKFKQKLEDERKVLIEELAVLGKMDPKTGDWEATPIVEELAELESDENDKADHFEDFEERTSTLNTLEINLKDVDLALEKIKNGKFGICEICNAPIEEARLDADTSARTCIAHKDEVLN